MHTRHRYKTTITTCKCKAFRFNAGDCKHIELEKFKLSLCANIVDRVNSRLLGSTALYTKYSTIYGAHFEYSKNTRKGIIKKNKLIIEYLEHQLNVIKKRLDVLDRRKRGVSVTSLSNPVERLKIEGTVKPKVNYATCKHERVSKTGIRRVITICEVCHTVLNTEFPRSF